MPPPLRVDYHSKEQQLIERASRESRIMNEQMDKIDDNLDNMSDSLKERFRRIVISQLSLLKYRQEEVFGENLNTYKSEISKMEHKANISTTVDNRASNMYSNIKVRNAVHENDHRENKYSNKTSMSGKIYDTEDKATSNTSYRTIESNHDRERDFNKYDEGSRISPIHRQAPRNVSKPTISPVDARYNLTSPDQKDKTIPAFNSPNRDDKIPATIKNISNEAKVLPNSQIAIHIENRRGAVTKTDSLANKTSDIAKKSPLVKRGDEATISTNEDHKGGTSPRHNSTKKTEHDDTCTVKESIDFKYETWNNSRQKEVLPEIDENESPVDVKGSSYIDETMGGNCSTPVSAKFGRRIPSPSFSPISAQGSQNTSLSLRQNQPTNLQGSPVKRELQTLVNRLEKYNDQVKLQTVKENIGLSEVEENNVTQTQSAFISYPNNLGICTMGGSNTFPDYSRQQLTNRHKYSVINNVTKSTIPSNTDEHNMPINALDDFSISTQEDLTHGSSIRTRTSPTRLHFQSTIRYYPIKRDVDFSMASKQKKHEVCCSDCSESNEVDKRYSSNENKQVNEAICNTGENLEATKVYNSKASVPGMRRISTLTPGTLSAMSERVIKRSPVDRNNGSLNDANLPSNAVTTPRTDVNNKAVRSNTHKLPNFSTDDKRSYLVSAECERGADGLRRVSLNKTTGCLNQAAHDTSSMVEAYAAIKMKLYNSALNSLVSSLKLTVEENVNRDFDREMWTALNKNVKEMKEEFKTFVSEIGSLNSDTWRVDLNNLNRLVNGLLTGDTISDRHRIKCDIGTAMCHLKSQLEDAGKKRLNLLSEVEKILDSLTDLTQCFAVCGDRYFGNKSSGKELSLSPKRTGTFHSDDESLSTSQGFIATAKKIQLRLMNDYTTKTMTDLQEDTNKNKNETSTCENVVQNNDTEAEDQDVLIGSNDLGSTQTEDRQQPMIPSTNQLSRDYFNNLITRRRMNHLRNYGFMAIIILGVAKFLAHFGPTCLQVVYDILVGIMMYLNCSIRLVHHDPNIT